VHRDLSICIYMLCYIHKYTYNEICMCNAERPGKCVVTHLHVYTYNVIYTNIHTGWRRPIGCLISCFTFRKLATNYRALLRKMTYKHKASYDSTPPCIMSCVFVKFIHTYEICIYLYMKFVYIMLRGLDMKYVYNMLRGLERCVFVKFIHTYGICIYTYMKYVYTMLRGLNMKYVYSYI